jgi:microcystin degradation protein MlrC
VVIDDIRAVIVKSSGNMWGFDRWRTDLFRSDTPGQAQSNLKGLVYTHLPRPIWPLDPLPQWTPNPLIVETPAL